MSEGEVTVKFGVNSIARAEFAGMTVDAILHEVEELLNVPAGTQARINGQSVNSQTRVEASQTLEFVKSAGEKGA